VALAVLVRQYDFSLAPGKPEVGMTTGEGRGTQTTAGCPPPPFPPPPPPPPHPPTRESCTAVLS
jgi:hypothetical protein